MMQTVKIQLSPRGLVLPYKTQVIITEFNGKNNSGWLKTKVKF